MRVTEVAKRFLVTRGTVTSWISRGHLRATKTMPDYGGHWYFEVGEKDIEDYLKRWQK